MFASVYHITITGQNNTILADAMILADTLLDAGVIAEKISEHYHNRLRINNGTLEIKTTIIKRGD